MDKEQIKFKKLLDFADDAGLAIFEELESINENIEEFNLLFKDVNLANFDGLQGEQGIQGEDGPMGPEGPEGKQGLPGIKGADGKNGVDGIDGLDGEQGPEGKPGKDGKDGSPDSPADIKSKLESLTGDARLDASAIKNLPDLVGKIAKDGYPRNLPQPAAAITYQLDGTLVGRGNILNLMAGSGVTINPIPGPGDSFTYEISASGGGGGGVELGGPQTGFSVGMIQYISQAGVQWGDNGFRRNSDTGETTINTGQGKFEAGDIDALGGGLRTFLDPSTNIYTISAGLDTLKGLNMDLNQGRFVLGDETLTGLLLDNSINLAEITGNKIVTQSAVVFSGSGLDDITVTANPYTGNTGLSYTLTITHLDVMTVLYNSLSPGGTFGVGETVTGSISGATGTVFIDDGSNFMRVENVVDNGGGIFQVGEDIDNGTGVTATVSGASSSVNDFAEWTNSDGGSGSGFLNDVIAMPDNVQASFGASQGHTVNDSWTWDYTVIQGGSMLLLNGLDHIYGIGNLDGDGNSNGLFINDVTQITDLGGPSTAIRIDAASPAISFIFGAGSYTFPVGNASGVLTNDGSGNLSWSGSSGGGLNGQTSSNISQPTPGGTFEAWFGALAGDNGSIVATTFIGYGAGRNATNADLASMVGEAAGFNATNASGATFFGTVAGSGATNAVNTTAMGLMAGQDATDASESIFFGGNAGNAATNAAQATFIGASAGASAENAAHSIFIGFKAGENDTVNNTGGTNSILIGDESNTGGYTDSVGIGTGVNNTTSNQFLVDSPTAPFLDISFNTEGVARMGDVFGANNGNLISVNDSSSEIRFTANSASGQIVFNNPGNEEFARWNYLNGIIEIGDIGVVPVGGHGTTMGIDYINDQFYVRDAGGDKVLQVNPANEYFFAGDTTGDNYIAIDGLNNDVRMKVNGAGYMTWFDPTGSMLQLQSPDNTLMVGRHNSGNLTHMVVDDDIEQIYFDIALTTRVILAENFTLIGNAFVLGNWPTYTGTGTYSIPVSVSGAYYDPATVNATGGVQLPTGVNSGHRTTIALGGTITAGNPVVTAWTTTAAGGATVLDSNPPGTLLSGDSLTYIYRGATNAWYRIG